MHLRATLRGMRNHLIALAAVGLVAGVSANAKALDVDIEGVALIGTGVDTGDQPGNPYGFQIGGAAELTINGFVGGIRATRAVDLDDDEYKLDLRSFGGDLGFDWEFALLHVSPRLGLGHVSALHGDFKSFYLEPGGVVEVEVGWFVAGVDIRYRIVTDETDMNGLLAYARLGLRF